MTWDQAFDIIPNGLKQEFRRYYPHEDTGELSPGILGLREAFHTFPPLVDVLVIETGDLRRTLFALHFKALRAESVNFQHFFAERR